MEEMGRSEGEESKKNEDLMEQVKEEEERERSLSYADDSKL